MEGRQLYSIFFDHIPHLFHTISITPRFPWSSTMANSLVDVLNSREYSLLNQDIETICPLTRHSNSKFIVMKSHTAKQIHQMAQDISDSIGLNYLMAEAVRDDCQLILRAGKSSDEECFRTERASNHTHSPDHLDPSILSISSIPRSQRRSMPLNIPRSPCSLRAASWPSSSKLVYTSCTSDSDEETSSLSEIEWNGESCVLPCLYEAAFKLIVLFLMRNHKSIVKLQMVNDAFYPINKNIIIYVPYSPHVRRIKRGS